MFSPAFFSLEVTKANIPTLYSNVVSFFVRKTNAFIYRPDECSSLPVRSEREEHVVPAPLVCPEGESAVLSGAPGRPRPDRRDRARGLRRSNRRFGGLVLSGVHRPGTSLLSARRRRSAEPKELGERSPVSQPHLHLTSRQRPRTTLPRSATNESLGITVVIPCSLTSACSWFLGFKFVGFWAKVADLTFLSWNSLGLSSWAKVLELTVLVLFQGLSSWAKIPGLKDPELMFLGFKLLG